MKSAAVPSVYVTSVISFIIPGEQVLPLAALLLSFRALVLPILLTDTHKSLIAHEHSAEPEPGSTHGEPRLTGQEFR